MVLLRGAATRQTSADGAADLRRRVAPSARTRHGGGEAIDAAEAIRSLMDAGRIYRTLFDEKDLAEIINEEHFPGERLIVCRNPLLADECVRLTIRENSFPSARRQDNITEVCGGESQTFGISDTNGRDTTYSGRPSGAELPGFAEEHGDSES